MMRKPFVVTFVILFLFSLLAIPFIHAYEIDSFVNDYADVLTDEDEYELTSILISIFDSGAAEYAVVTVPSLGGQDIESYSFNLANGVLGDPEKNNGLLLLVAIEDREYRFEVGRGLEPTLNDALVGRIGRYYLVPYFKEGNYGQGMIEASLALERMLINGESLPEEKSEIDWFVWTMIIFALVFMIFPFVLALFRWKRTKEYFTAAAGAASMWNSYRSSGGFSGSRSGGRSGRSFGGGSFGGGGSSGRW
ncbi:TPM domain-containing protein [Candidatus Woesearchaeota archaeon]|nr:MAG: TPM domain-containing protein [Candidatus Woesearchaeota archaeon]